MSYQDTLVILAALLAAGVLARGLLPRQSRASGSCGCAGGCPSRSRSEADPSTVTPMPLAIGPLERAR